MNSSESRGKQRVEFRRIKGDRPRAWIAACEQDRATPIVLIAISPGEGGDILVYRPEDDSSDDACLERIEHAITYWVDSRAKRWFEEVETACAAGRAPSPWPFPLDENSRLAFSMVLANRAWAKLPDEQVKRWVKEQWLRFPGTLDSQGKEYP